MKTQPTETTTDPLDYSKPYCPPSELAAAMKPNPTTNAATPGPWTVPGDSLSIEQAEAVSRLIASAPDMAAEIERLKAEKAELVAASKALLRLYESKWSDELPELAKARAAIAKSEGSTL